MPITYFNTYECDNCGEKKEQSFFPNDWRIHEIYLDDSDDNVTNYVTEVYCTACVNAMQLALMRAKVKATFEAKSALPGPESAPETRCEECRGLGWVEAPGSSAADGMQTQNCPKCQGRTKPPRTSCGIVMYAEGHRTISCTRSSGHDDDHASAQLPEAPGLGPVTHANPCSYAGCTELGANWGRCLSHQVCTKQTEWRGCSLLSGHLGAHYDPNSKLNWT